ncbi:hypothetical protein ES703_54850 [subsurface metagenome]
MAAEAQTCAIGILTILNILVALHLSRGLYRSTLFMQNKANLLDSQMNVSSVLTKDYENEHLRRGWKNKAKQTQSNPISPFPPIQDNFSFNYLREIYAGGFLRQRTNQSAIISVVSNEMIERNN